MVVRLHEVVDSEVVLAIIKPCPAPNDLLELNDGVNRAHENDVTDIASVNAGSEFLRCGQDCWDGLLVVLKGSQVLVAYFAVVGCDPLAIVRVFAGLHLVDEVAHSQRMSLRGTEHQSLLSLIDLRHKDFDPLLLPLLDLYDLVEVWFCVALPGFDLTLNNRVIGRIHIIVERRGNLLHFEGGQEAVVDAFLERVDVDRLAEVGIGVHVVPALGCSSHAHLYSGGEVVQNAAPVAFVVCAASMALVNDNEVEEVGGGIRRNRVRAGRLLADHS